VISDCPYYLFPEELPEEFCSHVIKLGKALLTDEGFVYEKGNNVSNINFRKSKIAWFNMEETTSILQMYAQKANQAAGWNFDLLGSEIPQFATYEEGGKYDWHVDIGVENKDSILFRKLTVIINLNTGYEGGDFQLQGLFPPSVVDTSYTIKYLKKIGSIVVLPSFLYHRVTPVTKGYRHSLTCWFRGPQFR